MGISFKYRLTCYIVPVCAYLQECFTYTRLSICRLFAQEQCIYCYYGWRNGAIDEPSNARRVSAVAKPKGTSLWLCQKATCANCFINESNEFCSIFYAKQSENCRFTQFIAIVLQSKYLCQSRLPRFSSFLTYYNRLVNILRQVNRYALV